ncbi:uncharacterized protein LOC127251573 [Andrographis paniculata]|uniref:uncharacterized protein LOC127251573 n=1 Tax=Andrographis paniculata TaxID=175694 RepID=UPI0021E9232A|nr:uncharacterized protein LOC127251573 [Andrographis paniculata]
MKALSKPLSSPGRAGGDKFPPPLMRFLRSNAGSRSSRGRSRSSPLFYLRSRNKNRVPIETTQEPSSPKVTCIGQVRVRRAAKSKGRAAAGKRRRWWWWVKKPFSCGKVCSRFRRSKSGFGRFFCSWGWVWKFGDSKEDSFRVHSDNNRKKIDEDEDEDEDEDPPTGSNNNNYYNNSTTSRSSNVVSENDCNQKDSSETPCSCPPQNALILTRCRSAPYRSSSLGGRFWGSPLSEESKGNNSEEKLQELGVPIIESCKGLGNSSSAEKDEEELKVSSNGGEEEEEEEGKNPPLPLVLTRCKSEPARIGERLVPQSNISNLRS